VLVPRFADETNLNAQNLNAKSLLTRFSDPSAIWSMVHYESPSPAIAQAANVRLTHLLPRHLWRPHLAVWYQKPADAIFYPGVAQPDEWGLRLRARTGRKIPVVSTLEALAGTAERERQLSEWAGHPVFCQRVNASVLRRLDNIYRSSDHIIAISPFLARMGRKLYGDKCSVHMLGIEGGIFFADLTLKPSRPRIVSIGAVRQHKRPEQFLRLAASYPEADFLWFGEGDLLRPLAREAAQKGITNLTFAGIRNSVELANELRAASVFAMPSLGEGVPKVTQEAAACGLPVVIFGCYESPTVADGKNGFAVSSDEEFALRVGQLLSDSDLRSRMGICGLRMAERWNWDSLATEWESEILSRIG
jgi:glycosyltransferase involved in cell wall biosynthesis